MVPKMNDLHNVPVSIRTVVGCPILVFEDTRPTRALLEKMISPKKYIKLVAKKKHQFTVYTTRRDKDSKCNDHHCCGIYHQNEAKTIFINI